MAVKNIAASVLAKLRNQAKQEGINYRLGFSFLYKRNFCAGFQSRYIRKILF